MLGVPIMVVNAVEDAVKGIGTAAQHLLHAPATFRSLNLPGVTRTDCHNPVCCADAALPHTMSVTRQDKASSDSKKVARLRGMQEACGSFRLPCTMALKRDASVTPHTFMVFTARPSSS